MATCFFQPFKRPLLSCLNYLLLTYEPCCTTEKTNKIVVSRTKSQPIKNRTGGSTFKNPSNVSAWKLIDKINYRGKKIGDASVSTKHTNFLINDNNTNSLDLEILGEEIKESVKQKFNINLDWELKIF